MAAHSSPSFLKACSDAGAHVGDEAYTGMLGAIATANVLSSCLEGADEQPPSFRHLLWISSFSLMGGAAVQCFHRVIFPHSSQWKGKLAFNLGLMAIPAWNAFHVHANLMRRWQALKHASALASAARLGSNIVE